MPVLSTAQVDFFTQDGYVLVQQMFDAEEINLLHRTAKSDQELDTRSYHSSDGEGGLARLSLWNHPGNSIYGMVARCNRIVNSMEKLLDGEVYHYHSKMILKDAKTGGAWTWHQDYGYWYQNGLLFPQLASVMIAVDPATKENGCLQILAGSHHMGRLNHVTTGQQAGAEKESGGEERPALHQEEGAPEEVSEQGERRPPLNEACSRLRARSVLCGARHT